MSTIEGKARAVKRWVATWPELDGLIKLNAIVTEEGDRSVIIVPNDREVERFIDGTARREFTFALKTVERWSASFDDVNDEAEAFAESWVDWVSAQWPGNVPAFGAEVTGVEPLQNAPSLSSVYQDDGLAEYMFQARIFYIE